MHNLYLLMSLSITIGPLTSYYLGTGLFLVQQRHEHGIMCSAAGVLICITVNTRDGPPPKISSQEQLYTLKLTTDNGLEEG